MYIGIISGRKAAGEMTSYRIVARHVGYWRGQVHKWSTVWPFEGTIASGSLGTAITAIHDLEVGVNHHGSPGTHGGGLYEVAVYDHATGGVPIAVTTYFPWATPASWVDYTSVGWTVNMSNQLNTDKEAALGVKWLAGLSSSGKPVAFRKWFHSIPVATISAPAADVNPGDVTSLEALIQAKLAVVSGLGAPMGRGSRLAAAAPVVSSYYENHQMPRGRRRKASSAKVANAQAAFQLLENQIYGSI